MSGRIFLDSNILVYCIDERDLDKHQTACKLIETLAKKGKARISTQSLQEFFNVATKKLKCTKENAQKAIGYYAEAFSVHCNSVKDIFVAIGISIQTQFSFYDSLIIAAAKAEGCDVVYSEDLTDGQVVDGVRIENPFKP